MILLIMEFIYYWYSSC